MRGKKLLNSATVLSLEPCQLLSQKFRGPGFSFGRQVGGGGVGRLPDPGRVLVRRQVDRVGLPSGGQQLGRFLQQADGRQGAVG